MKNFIYELLFITFGRILVKAYVYGENLEAEKWKNFDARKYAENL